MVLPRDAFTSHDPSVDFGQEFGNLHSMDHKNLVHFFGVVLNPAMIVSGDDNTNTNIGFFKFGFEECL